MDIETGALLKMYSVYDEEYSEQSIQDGLSEFLEKVDHNGEYRISQE